jgi:hypothetical protein
MEAKEELKEFTEIVSKVKNSLANLLKYKGNKHYKKLLDESLKELNRSHKFLKAKIDRANKVELKEKFKTVDKEVANILSDSKYNDKLESIKNLDRFWPELEIEFENLKLNIRSFEVPEEIPMTECRFDLEEAIKDFDNGCFISSLVLCRRAYEGALVSLYKSKMLGNEPVEEVKCKHCKNLIRDKSYMGIAKLHSWAIDNRIITEKLKQVGFLLTDMGAGAAHPLLAEFPRDKEMARLGITATLTLLKEIHTKK